MARSISLFNDYSQGEDILSNHTGLILKLLYENDPTSFEEVISNLSNEEFSIAPSFQQQVSLENSRPDLFIKQNSFSIAVETKTTDWFYDNQIYRHAESLNFNTDYKMLFLLSNFEDDQYKDRFSEIIEIIGKKFKVIVSVISFEELVDTLESIDTDIEYSRYLSEFRSFLDRNSYLPTWKNFLSVVNCASSLDFVSKYNAYICPDSGGKYRFKRFKYFGGYKNKNVPYIYELRAVVAIAQNYSEAKVWWNNFNQAEDTLISEALKITESSDVWNARIEDGPIQVLLLQNGELANFKKSSTRGLFSHKKYFRDICRTLDVDNIKDLAKELSSVTWEDVDDL